MSPRSILIIDDDEQIRAFLRQVLEEAGYMVIEAPNGRIGLRRFQQTPTALVITDLLMPDRDGLEVTMALHRDSPTVKIIVLSGGSGQHDYLDAAKLLGAHRTMQKPIRMAELLEAVQQELQGGSLRKGHGPQGER
ncbi:MAG: response regulator [Nitrospirae bacterium]|nr:response regulator [Nitrospirota bacterium]MDE3042763.1 response regulator [Nitrospirota bacterium]MDE3050192.1 response regulator [Nitrospirota bacterium]MDE3217861.1 response regulator [Nitrospirota bacterium]